MRRHSLLHALLLGTAALAAIVIVPLSARAAPDAARGQKVFALKHCARCHLAEAGRGGAPGLEEIRRPQGAWELAGRLWNHAPAMFTALTQERLAWPKITEDEMADLMAYLRADAARDPAPDLYKGQATLVRKGCLKCHPFRGEGGRVGPDLSQQRPSYTNPPRWAATLWDKAPRMAQASLAREALYPRFTGDEMVNLVEYLRRWK